MIAIRANLDKNQYRRLYRKIKKIGDTTVYDGKTLPYYLGVQYRNLLLKNIWSNKFANTFDYSK